MTTARRVVVTGIGAVSPLGLTFKDSWAALLDHKSGATSLKHALECQGLSEESLNHEISLIRDIPCQVAAPVQHWNQDGGNRTSRNVQFALSAAREAMEQANLLEWLDQNNNEESSIGHHKTSNNKRRHRIGVSMGCGMTCLRDIVGAYETLADGGGGGGGYRKLSPHFVPKVLPNSATGRLSIEYGLMGPNCTTSTACAAASHAIGDAYRIIQSNQADVMLAGGSEAAIDPYGMAGFGRLRALSTQFNDDPTRASRPFDARRDGFVMGEGAAVLILEELQHALHRSGAPSILAEVIGYGMAGDGHHITAPDPKGLGAEHAMRMALLGGNDDDDGLAARVDYVNAHATSTPVGDEIEAQVIHRVLSKDDNATTRRRRSGPLFVSSTKGSTGHLLGAAGAVEAAFTVQALVDQRVPPTLNLQQDTNNDDESSLGFQHVTSSTLLTAPTELDVAMSNSFGFGGTNACLVFQRFQQ